MKLNKNEIMEYQQNRDPYLMIDYVDELVPGKSVKGFKILKEDEWFFKVHWKNNPNMPGMLQIEALVQMAALSILSLPGNKGKVVYLIGANNLKFLKKIIPGDKLIITTILKKFSRGIGNCSGEGFVDGKLACKAEFDLVLPEKVVKVK
jgi:3-hydroxyacyl-[acyl-carrier-protein] dehydratase